MVKKRDGALAALGIEVENPQRVLAFARWQGEDLERIARPQATPLFSWQCLVGSVLWDLFHLHAVVGVVTNNYTPYLTKRLYPEQKRKAMRVVGDNTNNGRIRTTATYKKTLRLSARKNNPRPTPLPHHSPVTAQNAYRE